MSKGVSERVSDILDGATKDIERMSHDTVEACNIRFLAIAQVRCATAICAAISELKH